jgi:hypothetical protein
LFGLSVGSWLVATRDHQRVVSVAIMADPQSEGANDHQDGSKDNPSLAAKTP